jgi:exopolysaccharide production protein ExoQ
MHKKIFTILSLFIFSGALLPLLLNQFGIESSSVEGNRTLQIIYSCIYLITFFFIIKKRETYYVYLKHNFLYWILIIWILSSVSWSQHPDITLRKIVAVLLTTLFSVFLATTFSMEEILKILGINLFTQLILSYLFIFILPSLGTMPEYSSLAGDWRGIYIQKNSLGRYAALSAITFLILYKGKYGKFWLISFILAIGLLYGSRSITSYIVFFLILFFYHYIQVIRWPLKFSLHYSSFLFLVFSITSYITYLNIEKIISFLGRDYTLTGRTTIWDVSINMALKKPWMGYGFSAFWLGDEGPSTYVWRSLNYPAAHSHNGFLDLWLNIGVIGVVLFFLVFSRAIYFSFTFYKKFGNDTFLWNILFLVFFILNNISESVTITPNNIIFCIFIIIVFKNEIWKLNIKANLSGESISV